MSFFSHRRRAVRIEGSVRDVRRACRSLLRTPGFTAIVVLTLAMGMGLNTAIFSMVHSLLLPPTPLDREWAVVSLRRTTPEDSGRFGAFSPADYFDLKREEFPFGQFAAYVNVLGGVSLAEPNLPAESFPGKRVSSAYFSVMGLRPILGREFRRDEETVGRDRVVILSHAVWRGRFAGDTAVIGRLVRIDGEAREVVGVLPAGRDSGRMTERSGVYLPLSFAGTERHARSQRSLNIVGRRASTVSEVQGRAFVAAFGASLAADHPAENGGSTWRCESLFESTASDEGRVLLGMLLGLSSLVLLIACSNLANLFLARTLARAHELAVRASLGASRVQLLRPLAFESLLLVAGGAGAALLGGQWAGNWLNTWSQPEDGPRILFPLDWRVLGYTLVAGLGIALFSGVGPALLALRVDLQRTLKSEVRGITTGPRYHRLRQLLIVGQFTMAMVLLAGAGFLQRGGSNLWHRSFGWDVERIVQGTFDLPVKRYSGDEQVVAFQRRATERLAELPGVEAVSVSQILPVEPTGTRQYLVEIARGPAQKAEPRANSNAVAPEYFTTLGVKLTRGRLFTDADDASSTPVAVISESLARIFGEQDPLGVRLAAVDTNQPVWLEVVGVVADVGTPGLRQTGQPFHVYRPFAQEPARSGAFAVRLSGTTAAMMLAPIRSALTALDPDLPVKNLMSAQARIASGSEVYALKNLLSAFALLGTFLAALGIYGMVARMAAQRTREIGIRMALGAKRSDMFRLILGSGFQLALFGSVFGFLGAMVLSRLIGNLIPGIQPDTALVAIGACALLLGVALFACYLPARRATSMQPMLALSRD